MQDTTLPWLFNMTPDDLSYISEGINATYDLTTSFANSLSTTPLTDILNSVTTALPSMTTLSDDAFTYLGAQDTHTPSLSPSLATSLLMVLPFTK